MNFEQKERFEQLKKANKKRQQKEEIEKNVLLLECMEALGTEGKVVEQEEKNVVYNFFKNKIPFLPSGVDWKQFDLYYNIQCIKEMFRRISLMVKNELMWNISNLDAVPIDTEDYSGVGGTVNSSRQRVYLFQQKILNGHQNKISIFDGDIVNIQGVIEDFL